MDDEMDGSKSSYRVGRCYAYKFPPVFTVDPYNSHETLAIWTEGTLIFTIFLFAETAQRLGKNGFQPIMSIPMILE